MGFLCARLCITGTRFLRPPANQKFIWKRIERFFLNLYLIIPTLNATFWAKKIWRPVNPCKISKANFFKKWTFFKNFGIFRISSMSWLEKWSYFFDLMNFVVWPFLAQARQLKLVNYHSLTHLRLFSMLSDVKLGHFEVITPQQYFGYPWCNTFRIHNSKIIFYRVTQLALFFSFGY